ncbi:MAG TPA: YSC84-related protein [Anaeromyxobacteraceae bacterium]|nr:YSC84-related protein [Anaeromyxobacteraceae bacterium]
MSPSRALPLLALLILPAVIRADSAEDIKHAQETADLFKKTDQSLKRFFEGAAGWAVFPTVGKGAIGIGGAHGSGVLFEGGKAIGSCTLTQVTVGLQLGGQAYSEIVFFETPAALTDFKKGTFALAAQMSAVAAAAGASVNAKYQNGVAVFTIAKGGLMYEASVGGQNFTYEPFDKKK